MDDDPDTQAVVRAYAADRGLSILVAESGQEALALLATGGSVDVVVSDVTLPGLSGPALFDEVQTRFPDVRGLFVSGNPEASTSAQAGLQAGSIPTLIKPFDVAAFRRAVLPLLRNQDNDATVVDIQSGTRSRG